MPNIELHPAKPVSTFRRLALGTWLTTYDPSVYGSMNVPMDAAMDYIARYREQTGRRLTISHLMARAAAAALEAMPQANAILRYNRPYERKQISILFQVTLEDEQGRADLSAVVLRDVDKKDVGQLIDEFEEHVSVVRGRKDEKLEKVRSSVRLIPFFLMNLYLRLISFLAFTLNLDLRWAGFPQDPFGSMMITNIGSLGLDTAYVPLVPYARVPILFALGAVKKVPVVDDDDQIVVASMMGIHVTFDHRFIDGSHAATMAKVIRTWMTEPDAHFGEIPTEAA